MTYNIEIEKGIATFTINRPGMRNDLVRVVAGSRRGIPLKSLQGTDTRPTSDKVKESVFNMIGPYFDGGIAVELFGGSGSLSLEALSRGVDEAYIFEKSAKACAIIS